MKSDLLILLYKAPHNPAPALWGIRPPCCSLVLCPSLSPMEGTSPFPVLRGSPLFLHNWPPFSCRSQIKCCFFIEPFSTTPQRLVHLTLLTCPVQSTWLFRPCFDASVPLWLPISLPHHGGKSMNTGVVCLLLYEPQCLAQRAGTIHNGELNARGQPPSSGITVPL